MLLDEISLELDFLLDELFTLELFLLLLEILLELDFLLDELLILELFLLDDELLLLLIELLLDAVAIGVSTTLASLVIFFPFTVTVVTPVSLIFTVIVSGLSL